MPTTTEQDWCEQFKKDVKLKTKVMEAEWEPRWKELCDGKQLFIGLQKRGILKVSHTALKRKILQRMKETKSENWRLVERQLKELLGIATAACAE